MITIGIFGDTYTASTGFATVLRSLSNELCRYFRVIYFGRFGQDSGFAEDPYVPHDQYFEYVPCEGGVWDKDLVIDILNHYDDIDIVFTEDDFYSVHGILAASMHLDKPFHFHTPIDSLPVSNLGFREIFTYCDKIYIPNSSWELFNNMDRIKFDGTEKVIDRQGDKLKSVHLPHGVNSDMFFRKKVDRTDRFTFLWNGRSELRKYPSAILRAFEKIHDKMDADLLFRSDYTTPDGKDIWDYIEKKDIPIILDQMSDIPHHKMCDVYNMADINVCTAMAGGFEIGTIEAAACELPTIVTDSCFMNEIVEDGKNGFRIPIRDYIHPHTGYNESARKRMWGRIDIDLLADKMYWCYLNQDKVKMMGRWARQNAIFKYNWRDISMRLRDEIKNG
jgi:glycosyltransferase involved in cell wall biosynthesis